MQAELKLHIRLPQPPILRMHVHTTKPSAIPIQTFLSPSLLKTLEVGEQSLHYGKSHFPI